MQRFLRLIVVLAAAIVVGCGSSARVYKYVAPTNNVPPASLVEVKVMVPGGVKGPQKPGSLVNPFSVNASICKGAIPGNPATKKVRIDFNNGLADLFLTGRTNLTLLFTTEGDLYRVKEIPVVIVK